MAESEEKARTGSMQAIERAIEEQERILDRDPFDLEAHARLEELRRMQAAAPVAEPQEPEAEEPIVLRRRKGGAGMESIEIEILERLLDKPALRPTVGKLLEPLYRGQEDFARLVPVLESYLQDARDREDRRRLHLELMGIYDRELGQPQMAFLVACRAFREDPETEELRKEVERLAYETDSLEELVLVYEEVWRLKDGTTVGRALVRRLARIKETLPQEKNEAIALWHRVLSGEPGDTEALRSLERLYRERGDFAELTEILEMRLSVSPSREERLGILGQLETVYEVQLQEPDLAFGVAARAFRENPGDETLQAELERLAEKQKKWEELTGIYLDEADRHEGSGLDTHLRERVAGICQAMEPEPAPPPAEPEPSLEQLLQAVEQNPSDSDGLAILEKLLSKRAPRPMVSLMLVPAYRNLGQVARAIPALEANLAETRDPVTRRRLLDELMRIYEHDLGQKPMAFTVACRAFREFHPDDGIRQRLERLARETGLAEELAMVYEEACQAVEPDRAVLRSLAQLREEVLDEKDGAVALWKKVLDAAPGDAEALMALERIHRDRRDYAEVAVVLRRLARQEKDPERRKDLHYELAGLLEEKLGRVEEAIQTYLDILASDPHDFNATKLLNRLCMSSGNYDLLLRRQESPLQ